MVKKVFVNSCLIAQGGHRRIVLIPTILGRAASVGWAQRGHRSHLQIPFIQTQKYAACVILIG